MSIAAFLLRVTPNQIHRRIIYAAAGLTCAAGLTLVFIVMFQCKPVSAFWNRKGPRSCLPIDAIVTSVYCYSAFAILTDFTFTFLPMYLIWKLQMDMKTKIVLVPIMGMAFMASLAVIIRLPYVQDFKKEDFLHSTTNFGVWSAVEQSLAITAGSLATLRPLLRKVTGHFKTLKASLWNSADAAPNHSMDSGTAQLTAHRQDEYKLQSRNP
uniref:Decarboxylase_GME9496 n=1 Tax=Daldinia eschscholzii IFB-TL01 TaxID=1169046 RepID=A0A0X9F300_9PEZI|nr:decarboxylase_GME9496 [Daldinia eschscholzii IFB-TL01]